MKKMLLILAALVFVFTLSACDKIVGVSDAETTAQYEQTKNDSTTEPDDTETVSNEDASNNNGADRNENTAENATTTLLATEPIVTTPATEAAPSEPPATEPPHSHEYSVSGTVAANCANQGYNIYSCSCGDSYKADYTEKAGHNWGEWIVDYEATFATEGEQFRRCSLCGASEVQAIEKVPLEVAQAEIAAAVVKYINQFRAEEGSTQLTYLPGMSQVAQHRSVQLTTNFAHDESDMREALAHYQYGWVVDMTSLGLDESYNYWCADSQEAIGLGGCKGPADEVGKKLQQLIETAKGTGDI